MLDLLYLALTAGFFALMLAYVRGCARLGGAPGAASGAAVRSADGAPGDADGPGDRR